MKRIRGSEIRAVILVWCMFDSSFGSASNLCIFDQELYNNSGEVAFNHLAQEHTDKNVKDNVTTYKYQLEIAVKNATNCGVRLRHDADGPGNSIEFIQPTTECQDFFDRRNATVPCPRRGPQCLDKWFVNSCDSHVTVSYFTTDPSGLPGRYEVMLQNGKIQCIPHVRSTHAGFNFWRKIQIIQNMI